VHTNFELLHRYSIYTYNLNFFIPSQYDTFTTHETYTKDRVLLGHILTSKSFVVS